MVGRPDVTTVESSICMSSAQATIKGNIRSGLAVFSGGVEAGGGRFSPVGAVDIAAILGGQSVGNQGSGSTVH
jgi:hypothetical protein